MPPRGEFSTAEGLDRSYLDQEPNNGVNGSSDSKDSNSKDAKSSNNTGGAYDVTHLQHGNKHWHWFKIGGLRFGVHGLAGVTSTILVSFALWLVNNAGDHSARQTTTPLLPAWLLGLISMSTLTTAWGSYSLLSQVPISSKVTSWIIPPHREAFRRTIAVMAYLNLRLVFEHLLQYIIANKTNEWNENSIQCAFCLGLLVYNLIFFCPRFHKTVDWFNGNTWVFIIPMWLGFSCDTLYQFPIVQGDVKSRLTLFSGSNNLLQDIHSAAKEAELDWTRAREWNTHVVNVPYIVLTMFCTLQVAFLFTLAFRNYVSIHTCYWTAAAVVAMLCYGLYSNSLGLPL
jgi:hypothetical protein